MAKAKPEFPQELTRKSAWESERMKAFESERLAYLSNFNMFLDQADETQTERVNEYLQQIIEYNKDRKVGMDMLQETW